MQTIKKITDTLLTLFPVRRSAAQKEAFRAWLMRELKRSGHKAVEESYGKYNGSVNVIAGDPERATVILAAHYDTPVRALLPNYVAPTNPVLHVAYHFAMGMLLVLLSLVLSFAVTFPLNAPELTFPFFVIFCVAALLLSAYGSANQHNANASSGVVALLALANRIDRDERICFVFFDNNERSFLGAKSFKKRHPGAEQVLLVDLNCVGNGEELLLMPSKYSRWDDGLLSALDDAFVTEEEKAAVPRVVSKGLVYYPTDGRKFKFHLAVAACKKSAVGSYVPNVNSKKDTVLNCETVGAVVDGLERFLPLYLGEKE